MNGRDSVSCAPTLPTRLDTRRDGPERRSGGRQERLGLGGQFGLVRADAQSGAVRVFLANVAGQPEDRGFALTLLDSVPSRASRNAGQDEIAGRSASLGTRGDGFWCKDSYTRDRRRAPR